MAVRKAIFADSWYPKQAAACEAEIHDYLSQTPETPVAQRQWVAGIVPHAGWYYSGRIACQVIDLLKEDSPPDVVVLFGMHLHPGSSNYIMPHGAWETPFGELPVSEALALTLMARFDFHTETPANFLEDNTIELQLPFVKYLLNPKAILALGVPPTEQSLDIGRAVVAWANDAGMRLKIIGSTDLTHYGANYGYAPKGKGQAALDWVRHDNDRQIIEAMLAMAPEKVLQQGRQNQNTCCAGAASTAIAAAKRLGATSAHTVAYATSHDKSPGDSFVGYVGMVFGK
jgi:MEMO1 family protein